MRKYVAEFKREAVKKIHEGQSVASVARELGCAESLLHRWKRDALDVSSDSEKEVIALRKKLREVELKAEGVNVGRCVVRLQMKRLGLRAIAPKRLMPQTTASRHTVGPSPNLLLVEANAPDAPGEVIVGDITYLQLSMLLAISPTVPGLTR